MRRPIRIRSFTWVALGVLLVPIGGCTVAQAVQSRNRTAEATKGAEVSGGGFDRPIEHVGRVRVYASQEYRAQRAGWESRVREMVDSAGAVLGPAFGVRLEVVDAQIWNPDCDPASLQECLAELAQHDPGDDVDWVVGLISAVPRFTTSFDELGMARLPGRHFLLRDLYAPGEREAIDAMFPAMAASKRTEIYRERQTHKRLVIFLHEWAHTMGALHTRRDDTILYPSYDSEMAGFSEENLRLVDASLSDRFPFDPSYPALSEFLAANDSEEWMPGGRDMLLAALQTPGAQVSTSQEPPPAQITLSGDQEKLLAGVSPEDQVRYAKANEQFEARDLEASWKSLEPLLGRYPGCYAIQHFGCSLAMHVGARQQAGEACRRAIDLAGGQ
jgi:hypothetical protein